MGNSTDGNKASERQEEELRPLVGTSVCSRIPDYQRDHRHRPGWWYTPLIPPLRRQRQEDHCQFEFGLIYILGSRPVGAT